MTCGKHRSIGAASQVELGQNAAHVVADRMWTQDQVLCDFEVGKALGDQQQHFMLTLRQVAQTRNSAVYIGGPESVQHTRGHRWVERRSPLRHRPNRIDYRPA